MTAEARAQQGLAPGGKAEPEPAPAELHPLSPIGPTPAAPKKESVAELMPPPEPVVTREQIRRSVRRSQMPPWRVKVEDWLEQAHEHPFAEVGAAVGIGLIAGLASRMVHRRPEEVSPKEHLQLGAKGLATAGASAFVALRPWIKKRLSAKALHHAAEMVQKRASRLARG